MQLSIFNTIKRTVLAGTVGLTLVMNGCTNEFKINEQQEKLGYSQSEETKPTDGRFEEAELKFANHFGASGLPIYSKGPKLAEEIEKKREGNYNPKPEKKIIISNQENLLKNL